MRWYVWTRFFEMPLLLKKKVSSPSLSPLVRIYKTPFEKLYKKKKWFINCYDFIFTWDTHAIPIWNMFLVHKVKTGSMVFLLRLVLNKLIQFYDYSCFSNILESHFFQKTRQVWIISLVDPWGLIHCTPQWTFSNEKIEIPGFLTFC